MAQLGSSKAPRDELYLVLREAADCRGNPHALLLALSEALRLVAESIPARQTPTACLSWSEKCIEETI